MIALRGLRAHSAHVLLNGPYRYLDPLLQQLTLDALGAPQ
jgi:hypothetical protein